MNPFKVLNINKNVSKKQIIQAAALGMREKKYSAREIAQAQKTLLDPVSRACQEFLYFVDLTEAKERLVQKIMKLPEELEDSKQLDSSQLKYLTIFDKKS